MINVAYIALWLMSDSEFSFMTVAKYCVYFISSFYGIYTWHKLSKDEKSWRGFSHRCTRFFTRVMNYRITLHTGHELSNCSSHGLSRMTTDIYISWHIWKKCGIPQPSLRTEPYNCEEKFDNSGQRNKTVILREKINSKFANYFPLVSGCRGMSRDKERTWQSVWKLVNYPQASNHQNLKQ